MRTQFRPLFTIAVCAALSLSACAKVNQSTSSPKGSTVQHGSGLPAREVNQTSIQGNWKNTCTQDPKTQGYYISEISIQNAVMSVDTTSYADANCAFPITEEERVSSITIEAASDVTLLTETLVTIKYKPLNAVMANLFNQHSYCGNSSWTANAPVTITDASLCSGLEKTLAFHTELFGSLELYLSDCATTGQTQCSSVRYVKVAN